VADCAPRHGGCRRRPEAEVAHSFYHVPASNATVSHLILENAV